jgi:hypothetical protein
VQHDFNWPSPPFAYFPVVVQSRQAVRVADFGSGSSMAPIGVDAATLSVLMHIYPRRDSAPTISAWHRDRRD